MGCCGKRKSSVKAIPKGGASREMRVAQEPPPPPPVRAPRVPGPRRPAREPVGAPVGSEVDIEGDTVCRVCGTRLRARMVWSARLRRRHKVPYCPTCSRG
jgi:hypothetical protein